MAILKEEIQDLFHITRIKPRMAREHSTLKVVIPFGEMHERYTIVGVQCATIRRVAAII